MRNWLVRYYSFALKEKFCQFENNKTRHDPWLFEDIVRNDDGGLLKRYKNILNSLKGILYPDCEYFAAIDIKIKKLKSISDKFDELIDKLEKRIQELSKNSSVNDDDIKVANLIIDSGLNGIIQNLNTTKPIQNKKQTIDIKEVPLQVYLSISKEDFVYDKNKFCQNAAPNILAILHRQLTMCYTNIFRLTMSIKNINIDYTEITKAFKKLGWEKNGNYVALPMGVVIPKKIESDCEKPLNGFGQSQIIIMKRSDLPSVEIPDRNPETPILTYENKDNSIEIKAYLKAPITTPSNLNFLRLIVVNSLFDGRKSELSAIDEVQTYFI